MDAAGAGAGWVRRANARPIGRTEFRQVTIEIGEGRRLGVRTLRCSDDRVARSLFCVMEPWALSNLNYVVTEHRGRIEPFSIQLYLPYVRGTLRDVPSGRRREAHLGSDFSYDDLRTWLYEEGHRYELGGSDGQLVRVRGVCLDRTHLVRHGAAPFDVLLDTTTAFVRGIDYLSSGGSGVVREYRADALTVVDGIAIAGRMTMNDSSARHRTTIHLEAAWFDRPVESGVFDSDFRRHTRDYLASLSRAA
jgi:hypothetical protein